MKKTIVSAIGIIDRVIQECLMTRRNMYLEYGTQCLLRSSAFVVDIKTLHCFSFRLGAAG